MKPFHLPLKRPRVTQRFGENRACISTDGNRHVITCNGLQPPPGYKSVYGPKGHQGIDYDAYKNQPIYCSRYGEVVSIDPNSWSGLDVRVLSKIGPVEYIHIYEHLNGISASVGDFIPTGGLVGWAGETGYASGVHLHFEIRQKTKNGFVAIDPETVLSDIYAKDILRENSYLGYILEQLAVVLGKLEDYVRTLERK